LASYKLYRDLQKRITQADSSRPASDLVVSSIVLASVGCAVAWVLIPVIIVDIVVALATGMIPYGVISLQRSRRLKAFDKVLADSTDMLARALRAGHTIVSAIDLLSEDAQEPLASEFKEVFKQQNLGMPLRNALLQLMDRVPVSYLRVLVTAILVQKDAGGDLIEILDRTAFVIRERTRIEGEIRIHTAQGRLTAWILSGLPVLMFLLLNCLNPGYSRTFLHDPAGRRLIYISLVLLAIGSLTIRRIINGIEV
jgi:tight adherence protein B